MSQSLDGVRVHRSRLVRSLLIVVGTISFAIGILGVFLPLLPTTVFMLIAAACYARASERFYARLLANKLCGPLIRQWREHRSIPRRAKWTALTMIVLTFAATITFFLSGAVLRFAVGVVGLGVFAIVWRLPVLDAARRAQASQTVAAVGRGR